MRNIRLLKNDLVSLCRTQKDEDDDGYAARLHLKSLDILGRKNNVIVRIVFSVVKTDRIFDLIYQIAKYEYITSRDPNGGNHVLTFGDLIKYNFTDHENSNSIKITLDFNLVSFNSTISDLKRDIDALLYRNYATLEEIGLVNRRILIL